MELKLKKRRDLDAHLLLSSIKNLTILISNMDYPTVEGEIIRLIRGETMSESDRPTLNEFTDKDYTPTQGEIYGTGYNWNELVAAAGVEPYGGIDNIPVELYEHTPFNPEGEHDFDFNLIEYSVDILERQFAERAYNSEEELTKSDRIYLYRAVEDIILNWDEDSSTNDNDYEEENLDELFGDVPDAILRENLSDLDYPGDMLPEVYKRRRSLVDGIMESRDRLVDENFELKERLRDIQHIATK